MKSSPSRPRAGTNRPTADPPGGTPEGPDDSPHFHGHRERLRARFLQSGDDSLPDYELLELVLFGAIPRRDVKPLAKDLLRQFGGLGEVLSAEAHQLRVAGCTDAVIATLKVTRAAGLRLLRAGVVGRNAITSWQALLEYCQAAMQFNPTEQFRILFLDKKNVVISDEQQQRGTVDHTPVYPREVAKRALELQASAVILVHNHPSGDPAPSKADIEMTKQIRDAIRTLGVTLHDHLIIGRQGHLSFRSRGLL